VTWAVEGLALPFDAVPLVGLTLSQLPPEEVAAAALQATEPFPESLTVKP
jgi:hypothetical protein